MSSSTFAFSITNSISPIAPNLSSFDTVPSLNTLIGFILFFSFAQSSKCFVYLAFVTK